MREEKQNKYGGRRKRAHGPDRYTNRVVKKCIEAGSCRLTVSWLLKVDVGVAQRATGNDVATDADGQDGSDGRELLEEHRLGDVAVQVSDVE